MGYIICITLSFFVAWKLGRKYQDFTDIMLAKRVAKLIDQREQVEKDRIEYEKWVNQDKKIANKVQQIKEVK